MKSIRAGKVNVADAFARVEKGQLFLYGCDVQPWETAGKWFQHEAKRPRRLLMHKREILKLEIQQAQKGFALPLLRLYWKNGKAKAEIGIGRGKTHRDQRYDLKARAEMREVQREVAKFNKARWYLHCLLQRRQFHRPQAYFTIRRIISRGVPHFTATAGGNEGVKYGRGRVK